LSSYDAKTTKAEIRIPSDAVTAIAFRIDHPGSYIAATTLGIAFVEEKNGTIEMLKRKRQFSRAPSGVGITSWKILEANLTW